MEKTIVVLYDYFFFSEIIILFERCFKCLFTKNNETALKLYKSSEYFKIFLNQVEKKRDENHFTFFKKKIEMKLIQINTYN